MKKRYIKYGNNSLKISLASIENYPLSWQDSTRILFLLKGSIIVGMENEEYRLRESYIEIINQEEIYYIKSTEEDNLVLIIDISPNFLEDFKMKDSPIYYYTNTLDYSQQSDARYEKLRKQLAILYYEKLNKRDGYKTRLDEELGSMLYHLSNNFHYLFYESEGLKEDDIQLERFTRIINYIKTNYYKRVRLQQIAESEYLTPQYLSYKIKDIFGQGFNDFLNKIRVEESRKLLLSTKMAISEISLEVGFSHVRYYNKHFKKIYGMTPQDYRFKNSKTDEELDSLRVVEYKDLSEALDYLIPYLRSYDRYNLKYKTIKRSINLGEITIKSLKINNKLMINSYTDLNRDILLDLKDKLKFKKILFTPEISMNSHVRKNLIDIIKNSGFEVELATCKECDIDSNSMDGIFKLYEFLKLERELIPSVFPRNDKELFSDELTIFTSLGFRTLAYYFYFFYSRLGDIIYEDEFITFTRSKRGYEAIIINTDTEVLNLSLRLYNLDRDFLCSIFKLNDKNSSPSYLYKLYGNINSENLIEFKDFLVPKRSFRTLKSGKFSNLSLKLEGKTMVFLKFR